MSDQRAAAGRTPEGRGHGHDHGYGHGHGHDHGHGHGHGHAGAGIRARLAHLVRPHSHEAAEKVDAAMESSAEGMRALWISLGALGLTAAVQAVIVALSGSVALLGDTVHNAADALTAVPLGIAFVLGRRPPDHRYTYGYGRAEDLAGIVIVLAVAASAVATGWAALERLARPQEVTHLGAVAAAGLAGFAGNELVARYRIRVGRRIGSAALVADGLHARADGFTSLAVLAGAGGVAAGWDRADPVVGLLITAAIAGVLGQASRQIYHRLMDAVDPAVTARARAALRATGGVLQVGRVRLRWVGHRLEADCQIVVDHTLSVVAAHRIAVAAEHALLHALPRLATATVHTDPGPAGGVDHHALLAGHRRTPAGGPPHVHGGADAV
ncbi:cation diffusion facilitator family transporter [Planomonospora venezuelensis]|uniref:Cation diffusion facilitator family transporter n=1 Tax=Planomonospora venezuelensis TaxID=1999 RepID=A0A841D3Y5_PLAVE|nr:cation diffusion facilitator family transporter [Planomonospora venezuelensis]MBB5964961.1 cation diffusion facilitator family transporter [Planomonospora venezuelensis]